MWSQQDRRCSDSEQDEQEDPDLPGREEAGGAGALRRGRGRSLGQTLGDQDLLQSRVGEPTAVRLEVEDRLTGRHVGDAVRFCVWVQVLPDLLAAPVRARDGVLDRVL